MAQPPGAAERASTLRPAFRGRERSIRRAVSHDGTPYVVTELLEGESLSSFLQKRPPAPARCSTGRSRLRGGSCPSGRSRRGSRSSRDTPGSSGRWLEGVQRGGHQVNSNVAPLRRLDELKWTDLCWSMHNTMDSGSSSKSRFAPRAVAFLASLVLAGGLTAQASDPSLPHLVRKEGRHALVVDGAPFLILGGQCHNSSAWPATLPVVWSAIDDAPRQHPRGAGLLGAVRAGAGQVRRLDRGRAARAGAREHKVRLVLLWFGTWKNGSPHYMPLWMKRQPEMFPRIIGQGRSPRRFAVAPSRGPCSRPTARAFRALMRHLQGDGPAAHRHHGAGRERAGSLGQRPRLLARGAEALRRLRCPAELLTALGKSPRRAATGRPSSARTRTSSSTPGRWLASSGRWPRPARRSIRCRCTSTPRCAIPSRQPPAGTYESGGPTDNVLDIWKAAAPAVDILAPDVYMDDSVRI